MRWKLLSIMFTIMGMALSLNAPAGAQGEITITLGLSEFMRGFPVEEALANFEAQNPGVKVQPVYIPFSDYFVPRATDSLEDHLAAEQKLAAAADVIMIDENNLSVEGTRAGDFLDLSPLVSSDSMLNPAVFIPAALESFRWDNGLWGLPAKISEYVLIYDVDAFDRAGLAYPNANWTLDDLANAARTLTERNSAGEVTKPGFISNGFDGMLLRSLLHTPLYDNTSAPHFFTPEVQTILEQWLDLMDEGIIANQMPGNDPSVVMPMRIDSSFALNGFTPPDQEPPNLNASALPGGSVGVSVSGYTVSAGTAYPQQAYALAKYLTESPSAVGMILGDRNARTDVASNSASGGGPQAATSGGAIMIGGGGPPLAPEKQEILDALLANALPASEMRFNDYLREAVESIVSNQQDAATALQNAELKAVQNLQTAADSRGTQPLIVATAIPEIVLNPGEIDLHFGAGFTAQTGDWERLMRDFAAADPDVGKVTLDIDFGQTSDYAERDDCFYLNYNSVPSVDLSTLLPIDPLLTTDASFSMDDVAGNILAQLQRDNRTWAYPLHISPEVLKYNADIFARAGVPAPIGGWTISTFADALRTLKNVVPEDKTPFANRSFGDSYLLAMIAAYGGLPLDFRTDPVTINFTDPATVEAIRQVLQMAKDGLIDYRELATNFFAVTVGVGSENADPIYNETVGGFGGGFAIAIGGAPINNTNPYQIVGYPTGTYTTATYTIGTAYISASAQNPNACYRLFRFLSEHPELFGSMPALRSQFSNPLLTASQGTDAVNFYTTFDALMQNQNTIVLPSSFSGDGQVSGMNILRRWLDKAFDNVVLNDADLLTELAEAQTKATAFQTCVTGLPAFDQANPATYTDGLIHCAVAVDPDAAQLFPPSRAG